MFYCIAGCHRAPGTCQLYMVFDSYVKNKAIEPIAAFVECQSIRVQAEFVYEQYIVSVLDFLKEKAEEVRVNGAITSS